MAVGRPTWEDLPLAVRGRAEAALGGRVVAHASQPGGYSPGPTDRLRCADGSRAFLKAVHVDANPVSPTLHRQEARVLAHLPAQLPVPRLLASFEQDGWVVLVISDVDGHHPELPWRPEALEQTRAALTEVVRWGTPCPVPDLPEAVEHVAHWAGYWRRLQASPPPDQNAWIAARLPSLLRCSEQVLPHLTGDTLCHRDLRSDNILIRPDGQAVLIDWPHAARSVPWLDAALLGIEIAHHDGHLDSWLRRIATDHGTDPGLIASALLPVLGYFEYQSRRPPPPGIPTLRAFQRAQGAALVRWLQHTDLIRLDASS